VKVYDTPPPLSGPTNARKISALPFSVFGPGQQVNHDFVALVVGETHRSDLAGQRDVADRFA
jgi:hypothetical protein